MLDEPYNFKIETISMIPPKMIVADFAISNEFNTHYMPKNEVVNLTIRVQNVDDEHTPEGKSINTLTTERKYQKTTIFFSLFILYNLYIILHIKITIIDTFITPMIYGK